MSMSYTLVPTMPRSSWTGYIVSFLHGGLLGLGLCAGLLLATILIGAEPPLAATKWLADVGLVIAERNSQPESTAPTPLPTQTAMTERPMAANLHGLVESISRRYRIAQPAIADIVHAAQHNARVSGIDPLLVLAMIAVESRFNPYAESSFGAQGLMQVIGRFHTDKFDPTPDGQALLDPETNIRVGVTILRDYLRRTGSLDLALKLYGGESDESGVGYAQRVLAEKHRLEVALQRIARS